MKLFRASFQLSVLTALVTGCQVTPPMEPAAAVVKPFPAGWLGHWRGTCTNLGPGSKKLISYPMELVLKPLAGSDRIAWTIIYGSGERRQVRAYELITVDRKKGHYQIDEKNSIRLEACFSAGVLHQAFQVKDTLIHVTFARNGDRMSVRMASFSVAAKKETGGECKSPPVISFPLKVVQEGELTKLPGEK